MSTRWRARISSMLAALAMTVGGVLAATTTPASAAAMACNYDYVSFNACLTIEYAGNARWDVGVGFDRYLPKTYADEILRCGSGIFAQLWGDDGGHPYDDDLGYVWLKAGSPSTGTNPEGLFAEFFRAGMNLNEDDGVDEVYAEVTYFDCHVGQWMTYRTGTLKGNFG